MKAWLTCLSLISLIAATYHWQQPLRDHLLGQSSLVSTDEWQSHKRELTFRGLDLPKDELIHDLTTLKLIRYHRLLDKNFTVDVSQDLASELKSWRKQWEKNEDREQRLIGQAKSEADLEFSMKEALLDRAWIEQQIRDEIQVSEKEIQSAFQAQREHLRIPEAYRVEHLFLSAHPPNRKDRAPEISRLRQQIIQGALWDDLVKKHSEDPRSKAKAGHLGWVSEQRMPMSFIEATQKLKIGEMSPPVLTPLGWHLIRLLERKARRLSTLDEVRTELETSLTQQRRATALDKLTQRMLHDHPGPTLQNDGRH